MDAAPKTLLAVDGNSLLHRAFYSTRRYGDRPESGITTSSAALGAMVPQVLLAVQRTSASAVVIGFDDTEWSRRAAKFPHYKSNRSPHPPELDEQLDLAPDVFHQMGFCVVVPDGLEADDVMASAATYATDAGWRTIIATSDRDSFALINDTTRVLRIANGGVIRSSYVGPDQLLEDYGVMPEQYRDFAALRGDPSDGLQGIPNVGPKRAAKLIKHFGSLAAILDAAEAEDADLAKIVGKSGAETMADPDVRATCLETWRIMRMLTNVPLDLDLDEPGNGLLPYPTSWVKSALRPLGLGQRTVRDAVDVLCE